MARRRWLGFWNLSAKRIEREREAERGGDKGRGGGARRGGPPSPRDDSAASADERVEGDPGNGARSLEQRKTTTTLLQVTPCLFLFPFIRVPFLFVFLFSN